MDLTQIINRSPYWVRGGWYFFWIAVALTFVGIVCLADNFNSCAVLWYPVAIFFSYFEGILPYFSEPLGSVLLLGSTLLVWTFMGIAVGWVYGKVRR